MTTILGWILNFWILGYLEISKLSNLFILEILFGVQRVLSFLGFVSLWVHLGFLSLLGFLSRGFGVFSPHYVTTIKNEGVSTGSFVFGIEFCETGIILCFGFLFFLGKSAAKH